MAIEEHPAVGVFVLTGSESAHLLAVVESITAGDLLC